MIFAENWVLPDPPSIDMCRLLASLGAMQYDVSRWADYSTSRGRQGVVEPAIKAKTGGGK